MIPRVPALALGLSAAILAAGCISPQNDRVLIDRNVQLEAFQPVPPASAAPKTPPPALTLQQPSVVSVDRANWQPWTLQVPVDGTAHNPTYLRHLIFADKTARQRGDYPTALTALELTGGSEREQQYEAPSNWGASALDIVMLIPRMIIQAPWRTRWSPDEAYARYWHPERPGTLPEEEPPQHEGPFVEPTPTPVTP